MPVHISWLSTIKSMGKTYPGPKKCKDVGGKQVCVSQKAWSVFYATGNKRHGSGFETRPVPKKVSETIDKIVEWYVNKGK